MLKKRQCSHSEAGAQAAHQEGRVRGFDALQGGVIASVVAQLFPVSSQDGLRVCVLWQAQHLRTLRAHTRHCAVASEPAETGC